MISGCSRPGSCPMRSISGGFRRGALAVRCVVSLFGSGETLGKSPDSMVMFTATAGKRVQDTVRNAPWPSFDGLDRDSNSSLYRYRRAVAFSRKSYRH
jgi:hypothetical protein